MKSPLFKVLLIILLFAFTIYTANFFIVRKYEPTWNLFLFQVYLYFFCFCLLTVFMVFLFKEKLSKTIGFFFLYLFVAKVAFFLANFKGFLLDSNHIPFVIKVSTVFSSLLFLWLEVYAYFQLLVKQQAKNT